MLNELSCWYFDWGVFFTAFGALATAAAAWQGYLIWRAGVKKQEEQAANRVLVTKLLMEEELARLSAHAVHAWRIAQTKQAANLAKSFADMEHGLNPIRGEVLIDLAENLSRDLGAVVATMVSRANMLWATYAMLTRAASLKDAEAHVLAQLSVRLMDACKALATVLESELSLEVGVLQNQVRTLQNTVEGQGVGQSLEGLML